MNKTVENLKCILCEQDIQPKEEYHNIDGRIYHTKCYRELPNDNLSLKTIDGKIKFDLKSALSLLYSDVDLINELKTRGYNIIIEDKNICIRG